MLFRSYEHDYGKISGLRPIFALPRPHPLQLHKFSKEQAKRVFLLSVVILCFFFFLFLPPPLSFIIFHSLPGLNKTARIRSPEEAVCSARSVCLPHENTFHKPVYRIKYLSELHGTVSVNWRHNACPELLHSLFLPFILHCYSGRQ